MQPPDLMMVACVEKLLHASLTLENDPARQHIATACQPLTQMFQIRPFADQLVRCIRQYNAAAPAHPPLDRMAEGLRLAGVRLQQGNWRIVTTSFKDKPRCVVPLLPLMLSPGQLIGDAAWKAVEVAVTKLIAQAKEARDLAGVREMFALVQCLVAKGPAASDPFQLAFYWPCLLEAAEAFLPDGDQLVMEIFHYLAARFDPLRYKNWNIIGKKLDNMTRRLAPENALILRAYFDHARIDLDLCWTALREEPVKARGPVPAVC